MKPLMFESHSHTPLCKHAVGLPSEYAAVAHRRGLRGLIVTCHNPMPDGFSAHVRMGPEEFDQYVTLIEQAQDAWHGRLEVRAGLEADYYPGYESWLERQLAAFPFHYVLGSVHPQLPEYKQQLWRGDAIEDQTKYFELLVDAAETGLFDCLAHPDLIKNETAQQWDPKLILPVICRALDRIAATGIAMELNTSGANKTVAEMNPFPDMLREMKKREIPVVIGADAHQPERVADRYEEALDLLAEVGYGEVSFFQERKRQTVAIREARSSLKMPEEAVV